MYPHTFKELKKLPTGQSTEVGEDMAASWKWYPLMDEALGGRPLIWPPVLVASAWGDSSRAGPGERESPPPKRQRTDPVLAFLEAESARAGPAGRMRGRRDSSLSWK